MSGLGISPSTLLAQLRRKRILLLEQAVNDTEPNSPQERVICREIGMIDAKMLLIQSSANKTVEVD